MFSALDFDIRVSGRAGTEQLCICPYHNDSTPSASFSTTEGLFYCHACGTARNAYQLAVERLGLSKKAALEMLSANNFSDRSFEIDLYIDSERRIYGENEYPQYLEQRRVSRDLAHRFGLEYSRYFNAIVFPLKNIHGKREGGLFRSITGETRYFSLGKKTPIWPMERLAFRTPKTKTFFVEGTFSAIRMYDVIESQKYDFLGKDILVFAMMGSDIDEKFVQTVSQFGTNFFLFDNDRAGRKGSSKCLKNFIDPLVYLLDTSPDDMENDEIAEMITNISSHSTVDLFDFSLK